MLLGRRSVKQQYSWMMSSLFLAFFWLFDELYKAANSVLVMLLRFVLLPRYEAFFSFAALFSFLEFYVLSAPVFPMLIGTTEILTV